MAGSGSQIGFVVIGIDHGHINGQVFGMVATGARMLGWWADEETAPSTVAAFAAKHADVPRLEIAALLGDLRPQLALIAAIPDRRAALAVAAMEAGADVMVDKPGCLTLDELALLRAAQARTGRIWSVCYSERHRVEACTLADDLVAAGRIGDVVQVAGFGPHALKPTVREQWFWQHHRSGGILADLATHHAHQFLHYTGSTSAEVAMAHIRESADRPGFQDYGEVVFAGDKGRGFARVDWLTPKGVPVFGDGRVMVLGTKGSIELRKTIDPGGRSGGEHLILSDGEGIEYMNAKGAGLPYFSRLADDILARSETAMPQDQCFLATELAIRAQAMAER